MSQLLAR